ncbi:MAG: endo-alpha-N-acetylgalactosaminidase family protein [Firmicutes bacterium]|nr:endo-alpha-N-acetylgalactosaminidase family protein [Bacillota bacterium]
MNTNYGRLVLKTDKETLNPLLEPGCKAKLTAYGIDSQGEHEIPIERVSLSAATIYTCGDNKVVELEDDGTVIPLNGGYVEISAVYTCCGRSLTDKLKIVVRPFYHEYHKTLTYKLFLAMEEYGSLRKPESEARDESVFFDFEETAELIRRIDEVTCGIPKIVYLVGWQRGGHDHLYPAFNEVNPRLKRKEDPDALSSLRWLIREGKKYNTDVSLHINLVDAWDDSPLWNEYAKNHIFQEDESGNILTAGGGFIEIRDKYNINIANVVQKRLWDSGFFKKRVDELLEMIPELADTHTIHVDNWRAIGCDAFGISKKDDECTICKMYEYFRERGLDTTSEGSFHGREQPLTGLQPMTWFDTPYHPSTMPPCLYCGGRVHRVDFDARFGDTIQIENAVRENLRRGFDPLLGIQDEFCLYTLPWQFLNNFMLRSFDGQTALYSKDVRAYLEEGEPVIYYDKTRIRFGTTLFVPMLWKEDPEILMYSFRDTYMSIEIPAGWEDVKSVDLYYVDRLGRKAPVLEESDFPIVDGKFQRLLDTRCAYIIKPHK